MTFIRKFTDKDMDEVYSIARSSLSTDYDLSLYISIWELWPDWFLVAEENGKVLGFLAGMTEEYGARILMIAVKKKHRGKGIGKALMKDFINRCNARGIRTISLEVRKSNLGAIEFYKSLGFYEYSLMPSYYEDGEDAIIMKKNL